LVVLYRESNDKSGKAVWLCRCECGNEKSIRSGDLRTGKSKSCGCLRREKTAKLAENRKPRLKKFTDRKSKYCPSCKETLSIECFGKNRSSYDGFTAYCSVCHNIKGKESVKKHWGNSRHYHLVRKYGITAKDADDILHKQGDVCALCLCIPNKNLRVPWHVDHDHKTGKVRGILCHHCNTGLGNLRDDTDVLRRAIRYLENER